jgi:zinc protease
VLRERMLYEFYHYPPDFLERYRASVEGVTANEVVRVARKYIHPDQQSTLIVGNAAEFEKTLSVLGPVSDLDITIPTAPKGAAPAQAGPAQSNPEGKALIAKFVDALGGLDKLRPIKSYRQSVTLVQQSPQGPVSIEVEDTRIPPDRSYTKAETPFGSMMTVISPQVAYMSAGGQVRDLPATLRSDAGDSLKRDLIIVALHADDPSYIFVATGTEKLDGKDVAGIDIVANGPRMHWLLDPQSGHLLQSSYDAVGPAGPVKRVLSFSDWKSFDGVNLPTKTATTENGQSSRESTLKNFAANPQVDESVFTKPAPAPEPPK